MTLSARPERPPNRGRILLLVGPSSVGKTSIARELQRQLPEIWLHAGVDLFWGMLDEPRLTVGEFRDDSEEMWMITRGWHRAVAALASQGNNVITEELWTHDWWLDDWRRVLRGFQWWSVLLTAKPEVLVQREAGRGDRPEGLAARDLEDQPPSELFDLVIDTSERSVDQSVRLIARVLGDSARKPRP